MKNSPQAGCLEVSQACSRGSRPFRHLAWKVFKPFKKNQAPPGSSRVDSRLEKFATGWLLGIFSSLWQGFRALHTPCQEGFQTNQKTSKHHPERAASTRDLKNSPQVGCLEFSQASSRGSRHFTHLARTAFKPIKKNQAPSGTSRVDSRLEKFATGWVLGIFSSL